jgi:hypothetical protein
MSLPGARWYYLYSVIGNRPVLRDYLTSADFEAANKWTLLDIDARYGAVAVTQSVAIGDEDVPARRTFRWTHHHGLVADKPLPCHTEADLAP